MVRAGILFVLGASACRSPEPEPAVVVLHPAEVPEASRTGQTEEPPESRPSLVAVAGGYALKGAAFLFWDAPVFVLYRVPKWVLWDAPSALVASLTSRKSRIGSRIRDLEEGGSLGVEDERRLFSVLEELTGLVFTERADWIAWWTENQDRPRSEWRRAYVETALRLLESEDYWERASAAARLRWVSGIDSGYDPKSPPSERRAAAEPWLAWWQSESHADLDR